MDTTQGPCHVGTYLGLALVNGNCHATAYKDPLNNSVLPNWWQQFLEGPHMGLMVRCQTFGHIMYFLTAYKTVFFFPMRAFWLSIVITLPYFSTSDSESAVVISAIQCHLSPIK